MKLELQKFTVKKVYAGDLTRFEEDGSLSIDLKELKQLLMEDSLISQINLDIVNSNESARIIHVLDVFQPRVKVIDNKPSGYFTGVLDSSVIAGQGTTNVLQGLAVTLVGESIPGTFENIIDLKDGAKYSRICQNNHVVITAGKCSGSVKIEDYYLALTRACAKTSAYLASTTVGKKAQDKKTFEIPSFTETCDKCSDLKKLPKVAYMCYLYSDLFGRQKFLYGKSTQNMFPMVIHPNEIIDGALIDNGLTRSIRNTTFDIMNNQVIVDLIDRHGKDLNFVGVVIIPHVTKYRVKEINAQISSNMVRFLLGATDVILTKDGGGQGDVDIMLAIKKLEMFGIRTVALLMEDAGENGRTFPFADICEEAKLIISLGNTAEIVTLKEVDRVIGGTSLFTDSTKITGNVSGKLSLTIMSIVGAIDFMGSNKIKAKEI